MRIGIPIALLYYYYKPLWEKMFNELGHEVVYSEKTNKDLIDKGIKISVPEICVPIKIFNGHIINLIEQKVDYIFIPRFITIAEDETFCPKFLGLTDMVRYSFPEWEDKLIKPDIRDTDDGTSNIDSYFSDPFFAKLPYWKVRDAVNAGYEDWKKFRRISQSGYLLNESLQLCKKPEEPKQRVFDKEITIGLMGYVYDIYDEFVSMNISKKLQDMGANVLTFEQLKQTDIDRELATLDKDLFWTFSNKLLGAGMHFYKNPMVDGIIHVTAFACGPDALIGKMLELDSDTYKKPFMTIRVDEHTGENHLQTRIEAFIDMLKKKKRKEKLIN